MEIIIHKIKKPDKLTNATKGLVFQNNKKEKRTEELLISNTELKNSRAKLKMYIQGLEKIILMISHKVRQSVAHIIGLSILLDKTKTSPVELKK